MPALQFQETQAATLERQFMQVFAANDSQQRINTRVWPDGVRTDNKTERIGAGLPLMKSVVVR